MKKKILLFSSLIMLWGMVFGQGKMYYDLSEPQSGNLSNIQAVGVDVTYNTDGSVTLKLADGEGDGSVVFGEITDFTDYSTFAFTYSQTLGGSVNYHVGKLDPPFNPWYTLQGTQTYTTSSFNDISEPFKIEMKRAEEDYTVTISGIYVVEHSPDGTEIITKYKYYNDTEGWQEYTIPENITDGINGNMLVGSPQSFDTGNKFWDLDDEYGEYGEYEVKFVSPLGNTNGSFRIRTLIVNENGVGTETFADNISFDGKNTFTYNFNFAKRGAPTKKIGGIKLDSFSEISSVDIDYFILKEDIPQEDIPLPEGNIAISSYEYNDTDDEEDNIITITIPTTISTDGAMLIGAPNNFNGGFKHWDLSEYDEMEVGFTCPESNIGNSALMRYCFLNGVGVTASITEELITFDNEGKAKFLCNFSDKGFQIEDKIVKRLGGIKTQSVDATFTMGVEYFILRKTQVIRNMSANDFGTICLPGNITEVTNATIYEVSGVWYDSNNQPAILYLEELTGEMIAGKPYIFQANEDGDVTFKYDSATLSEPVDGANGLVGTLESTLVPANTSNYVLGSTDTDPEKKWYYVDTKFRSNGYYGYLDLSQVPEYQGQQSAKALRFDGSNENPTNIDSTIYDSEDTVVDVYTVQGIKIRGNVLKEDALKGLKRGIYIVNGKKVVVM